MDPIEFQRRNPLPSNVPTLSFIERLKADRKRHQEAIDYLTELILLYEQSSDVQKFVSLSEQK